MALKPSTAKIIDLDTSVDVVPVETREGQVVWATVKMEYTLAGLNPTVTICVPVPFRDGDTQDERRAQALRCARGLIDHACRAAGVGPTEAEPEPLAESMVETVEPSGLEGIAQELGLAEPTQAPKRARAAKTSA